MHPVFFGIVVEGDEVGRPSPLSGCFRRRSLALRTQPGHIRLLSRVLAKGTCVSDSVISRRRPLTSACSRLVQLASYVQRPVVPADATSVRWRGTTWSKAAHKPQSAVTHLGQHGGGASRPVPQVPHHFGPTLVCSPGSPAKIASSSFSPSSPGYQGQHRELGRRDAGPAGPGTGSAPAGGG